MMASQLTGRCVMRWALSAANISRTSVFKLSYHTSTTCAYNAQTSCQRNGNKAPSVPTQLTAANITRNAHQSPPVVPSVGLTTSTVNLVHQLQDKLSQMSVSPLPSGMYLSPQSNVEYKLPAHLGNELAEQIIVDPAASNAVRECPTILPDTEIMDPRDVGDIIDMPPLREETEKQAKVTNIILIRRKKMKKHKLRKLRKRMKFLTKIILHRREKKKRKLWEAHLEKFKFNELTEEMKEKHMAKRNRKLQFMTNYWRHEAGLATQEVKEKRPQKPSAGAIIPTPILPAGVVRK